MRGSKPLRHEREAAGREHGASIPRRIRRQTDEAAPVSVDCANVLVADLQLTPQRDPRAVGRPGGPAVEPDVSGETPDTRSVRVHHIQLRGPVAGARKRDLPAVGRPRRSRPPEDG